MDNKENPMQPEPEISEAEMDLLLEKFLNEEDPVLCPEEPVEAELTPEPDQLPEPVEATESVEAPEAQPEELSPEEAPDLVSEEAELDATALEAFLAEDPAPLEPEDLWEDQPVDTPELGQEIGPDLLVEAAAGLTNPADLEFERIMEETLQEVAQEEALQEAEEAEELEAAAEESQAEALPEEDFTLADEYFLPSEGGSMEQLPPEKEPVYTELDMTAEQQQALEILQDAPEAEEEAPVPELPKKRRPKNPGTYGFFGIPHMLVTVIWLALILFIGAGIGTMIWEVAADMLAFGRPNQTVTITITANDDLDSIAQKLHDTGLIKYPGIFKFYGNLRNAEKKVKPGTYELNTVYDYMALVKNMSGTTDRVSTKVVIPEGYTCAQIFRLLEKNGVCTVEAMEEAVMNADLSKYWFLEGIDQSNPNCLEGYLFPDTYQFYLDHDPNGVLTRLLDTFDKRFSDTMREKLDLLNENLADMMRSHGLSESYIQANLFTMRELVIVASMIEKETSGDEESYYIASVIYNRLTNPGEYPYLNIDAALVYITGRSPITAEDLKLDTPYNTYLYKGLIPGPISNPGLASLNAALSPENTEYYYYALDPAAGTHKFFKTYKAHQDFLASLRNGG